MNNPLKYTDSSGEFLVSGVIGFWDGLIKTGKLKGAFVEATHRVKMESRIWAGLFQTDPNKSNKKRFWELVSRFTWQAPQVLGGQSAAHVVNTIFGNVHSVDYKYGATVIRTSGDWGALTQGNYIIGDANIAPNANNPLFQHEYGHYIQSQSMGPAYYPRVGITSVLSSGDHDFHPVEQDANRRAFLYFNQNVGGFQNDGAGRDDWTSDTPQANLGWDFHGNPLNFDGSNTRLQYVNYASGLNVSRLEGLHVKANFWDYFSMLNPGMVDPVLNGLINAWRYNK
jgi:hypothetical protein